MTSKPILIILSYAVSKLVHFFLRHSVDKLIDTVINSVVRASSGTLKHYFVKALNVVTR